MNPQRLTLIGMCLASCTFLALWLHERSLPAPTHAAETKAGRSLLSLISDLEKQHAAELSALNQKLNQTSALLNETLFALKSANARIADLEFTAGGAGIVPRGPALQLAGINGATNTIPTLISPAGDVLAKAAEYSSRVGGRLFFKTSDGRKGFHVGEIHPVIVQALGFQVDELLADDQEFQQQRQARRIAINEAVARGSAETARMMREQAERERKLESERLRLADEAAKRRQQYELAQAQMAEQQRRTQAAEQLRAAQLQNERIRLEAELYLLQQNALRNPQIVTQPRPQSTNGAF